MNKLQNSKICVDKVRRVYLFIGALCGLVQTVPLCLVLGEATSIMGLIWVLPAGLAGLFLFRGRNESQIFLNHIGKLNSLSYPLVFSINCFVCVINNQLLFAHLVPRGVFADACIVGFYTISFYFNLAYPAGYACVNLWLLWKLSKAACTDS